jgi:hypothetical protein
MKFVILAKERDQEIILKDDKGKILYESTQTYDELGSYGRDAVRDVVIDLAKIFKVPVEEE